MMTKFEYVTKPLELKKETKDPTATKKNQLPKQNNLPRNSAKNLHKQRGFFVCSSLLINISFWGIVCLRVYLVN